MQESLLDVVIGRIITRIPQAVENNWLPSPSLSYFTRPLFYFIKGAHTFRIIGNAFGPGATLSTAGNPKSNMSLSVIFFSVKL
jgi:hypothetical protein